MADDDDDTWDEEDDGGLSAYPPLCFGHFAMLQPHSMRDSIDVFLEILHQQASFD